MDGVFSTGVRQACRRAMVVEGHLWIGPLAGTVWSFVDAWMARW